MSISTVEDAEGKSIRGVNAAIWDISQLVNRVKLVPDGQAPYSKDMLRANMGFIRTKIIAAKRAINTNDYFTDEMQGNQRVVEIFMGKYAKLNEAAKKLNSILDLAAAYFDNHNQPKETVLQELETAEEMLKKALTHESDLVHIEHEILELQKTARRLASAA